jgi:hypothetical protein
VLLADDRMPADQAYKLACEGTALLWQGDYHQARQLVQALGRRLEKKSSRNAKPVSSDITQVFHQHVRHRRTAPAFSAWC